MKRPCTQCGGTGSYPQFTRQVCSKCQGSRVEDYDANNIVIDRGIYRMGHTQNGERVSEPSWESNLEGGSVVIGKADTPFDIFNFRDVEGIFNHISEQLKLPVKLVRIMCDECDFDFYIKNGGPAPQKCPVCGELFTIEDDQEDEEE